MHWPVGFKVCEASTFLSPLDKGMIIPSDTDFLDTWEAMEEQVDVGMVKVIRISNFNCKTDGLLSKPDSKYKPANNQANCASAHQDCYHTCL
ncbi:hypothetical protein CIB84_003015 [Bambusicola thoracicus]|uniref:Uncharacterized protein n=1 Tax=Bambusicola thoracicus TaxID=9083 RepID=A0A2P4TA44_BAMTH|nr:hypothetical protein CIB84_003015 [Bambusicola thoracicus]